jgi:hypothetical protein
MTKEYLGDGAYAEFDGYGIRLTTENGYETTNTIYLEPITYQSLVLFVDKTARAPKATNHD